jgi:hypothetical protein
MKWNNFEESDKEYPEKIAERSIEGFSKATKGLAELKVSELSDMARITTRVQGDFLYNIRLISPFVNEYSLKIMTFGYDIELSPINFILDEAIHLELYNEPLKYDSNMVCQDSKMFSNVLEKVYASKRFTDTVAGLMKIARKYNKI